tara:strand:+ start:8684 stop:8905 length:222 start_codon:yes stop_codon:yes gene_type:complete
MARGPDPDTLRWQALQDARGQLIAEGHNYSALGCVSWRIIRSKRGKTNQVDLIVADLLILTGSHRTARNWLAT